jgi:hypothetical protein
VVGKQVQPAGDSLVADDRLSQPEVLSHEVVPLHGLAINDGNLTESAL